MTVIHTVARNCYTSGLSRRNVCSLFAVSKRARVQTVIYRETQPRVPFKRFATTRNILARIDRVLDDNPLVVVRKSLQYRRSPLFARLLRRITTPRLLREQFFLRHRSRPIFRVLRINIPRPIFEYIRLIVRTFNENNNNRTLYD